MRGPVSIAASNAVAASNRANNGIEENRIIVMPTAQSPEPPTLTPARAMRRPSPQQGRALELLGHAIEYLVDENLHRGRGEAMDSEAVQLLMRLNRGIFAECAVVMPLGSRLRSWMLAYMAA
jgi:hypothetical protein